MRYFIGLLCCVALGAHAETFTAKVIAVLDGDTVLILREGGSETTRGRTAKVRLANIDAPEKDQDFGNQSRASLLEMLDKRQVQIDAQAVDQYGRIVGLISVDGRNVNQEQVGRGMAWEYSHHHSNKAYLALQREARQARRGLWAQKHPQPPWQWRKLHPSPKPAQPEHAPAIRRDEPVTRDGMECGNKRHCSQMISCDEALFYLTRCGVKTLDRNRDGSPCESLCAGREWRPPVPVADAAAVRGQPAQPNDGSLE